ncbi:MAG: DUF4350 domain-containing protein [Flavobacteriales bacterium]|nr:DUF4350 domain-containing protein [Flavobacteriales bacterium]
MAQKNKSNLTVIVIIAVMALLIFYVIWSYYSKPRHDWVERYRYNKSEPYDCQVMYNLLHEANGGSRLVLWNDTSYVDTSPEEIPVHSNYIFIGQRQYLDSTENSFLLDFVRRGNNAFIFSSSPSGKLLDSLIAPRDEYQYHADYYDENYSSEFKPMGTAPDTLVKLSFTRNEMYKGNNLDMQFYSFWKPQSYDWRYFKDSLYSREGVFFESLGEITSQHGSHLNYMRLPYGNGNFFLCSTPVAFTNYHLLKEENMEYARQALAFLSDGKIYWDEHNHTPDPPSYMAQQDDPTPYDDDPQKGPLGYVLSQPALKYAWFLLLIGAGFYLFFGGRRKQRSIPVNESRDNTSIEYAEVISQLFMKESDHKKLVLLKMDLFRAFLRERFALRLPLRMDQEDDAFYKNVSEKSSVPLELVRDIFEQHKYLSSIVAVNTELMLLFYNKIEQFYLTCK